MVVGVFVVIVVVVIAVAVYVVLIVVKPHRNGHVLLPLLPHEKKQERGELSIGVVFSG